MEVPGFTKTVLISYPVNYFALFFCSVTSLRISAAPVFNDCIAFLKRVPAALLFFS